MGISWDRVVQWLATVAGPAGIGGILIAYFGARYARRHGSEGPDYEGATGVLIETVHRIDMRTETTKTLVERIINDRAVDRAIREDRERRQDRRE